ncbi:MAG: transcription termination factor Rho [Planctomycetes bacterium]|nr:transcription termination factor Rho [Planctomycetota bacterium]
MTRSRPHPNGSHSGNRKASGSRPRKGPRRNKSGQARRGGYPGGNTGGYPGGNTGGNTGSPHDGRLVGSHPNAPGGRRPGGPRGRGKKKRRNFGPAQRNERPARLNDQHIEVTGPLETVEGVLEFLPEGFGFLRRLENDYQPADDDVFVPAALIRTQELREGSTIRGQAGPGRSPTRSRILTTVELADGVGLAEYHDRIPFSRLTSIDPNERLRIDESGDASMRILDLVTPVGKGQRGLIVAAPRTGKTILLQKLAQSIAKVHPEVHLMIVLIDERPEEVTEMRRSTVAEVIASSSDQMSHKHVRVAEIVLERARRLVEGGTDVVILLDSLTRMARAYNIENRGSGRTLSGGLDAKTMQKPREFFGAARNAEEGGSLTILATALIDTGSRMDQVIFEEFKGTGNMEVVLHRPLADRRVWPAIDIHKSGTRKEEKLRSPETQAQVNLLRRILAERKVEGAMEALLGKIVKTEDNRSFLNILTTAR